MHRKSAPECAVEPRRLSRPALPPIVLCEPAHPKLTLPVVWIAWFSDTTKVWPSPVWAHQQPVEPWRCTLFVQVSASATIPSAALYLPPEREVVGFNSLYTILVAFRCFFKIFFCCVQTRRFLRSFYQVQSRTWNRQITKHSQIKVHFAAVLEL